jgi:hypothetical protein
MQNTTHDLTQIQRWMQSVIMHPGGVLRGIQADEAQVYIEIKPADIESVISPSQNQNSVERLEIYARAYYARLLECLRAEFPITVKAVGEELFDQFALGYLEMYPSQSYTLDHLGARFPQYLAETRPVDDDADTSWLDFLVDLARLEWNIAEVFDGPGAEGATQLSQDQIMAIPPERWADVRLVTVPCLRIIRLDFPIHDYYRALRNGQEAVPPDRAETFLAITRRNFIVRHIRLSPPEAMTLATIVAGATVGESIAGMDCRRDSDLAGLAANIQNWFRTWSAEGFFLVAEVNGASHCEMLEE